MFLKLLWILIVGWIAFRVYVAGRNLVRIAMGRDEHPLRGAGSDPLGSRDRPRPNPDDKEAPGRTVSDVEDARWVDL